MAVGDYRAPVWLNGSERWPADKGIEASASNLLEPQHRSDSKVCSRRWRTFGTELRASCSSRWSSTEAFLGFAKEGCSRMRKMLYCSAHASIVHGCGLTRTHLYSLGLSLSVQLLTDRPRPTLSLSLSPRPAHQSFFCKCIRSGVAKASEPFCTKPCRRHCDLFLSLPLSLSLSLSLR